MAGRRIAALALSGALAAGGAGVAIAAVTKDKGAKAEDAVLADAAKRLNVTPEKLRDALAAAQDAQIDQAVADGELTQEQADAIKARHKALGHVLGGLRLRGGPHLFGGRSSEHGPIGPGLIGDVAKALGISEDGLFKQLRSGRSVADVAKANGKSLDDVLAAVKAATKTRLDKAVGAGALTRKQADAILARTDEQVAALKSGKGLGLRFHRHLRGELPPEPKLRPGSLLPGEAAPEVAPPEQLFG